MRPLAACALSVASAALLVTSSAAQDRRDEIVDREGRVIEVLEREGRPRDLGRPPDAGSLNKDGAATAPRPVAATPASRGIRPRAIGTRGGPAALPAGGADTWPMFQANAKHTGFLPIGLNPANFTLRWQQDIGGASALNPVAAADGKVFVTLLVYFNNVPSFFALDAADGHTLWSKTFGSIFSVNPPSYAYGKVYLQTGNHGSDTWLRAFDGNTGAAVFQSPHTAQWERYFAPTIHDGKVYVNGGYYGGMYAFDAYTGAEQWFSSTLPQYDQWTPAVDDTTAYAYLGEYGPGLYERDRLSGAATGFIADPNFDWGGWSMNLAPVLGDHDDIIAIHDGRLISFDVAQDTIRWEIQGPFTGQPSVAQNRIYAVKDGRLVVLDEITNAEIWSWQPPDGAIAGPMILTQTHILASTAQSVHAVDLLTQQAVWTYPAGGHLAMADDTLYIASADGMLRAIAAPRHVPAPLVSLEITGPTQVLESSSATYRALAHYEDATVVDRTLSAQWSVAPDRFAIIDGPGLLRTGQLIRPSEDVVVTAVYSELGQTVQATLDVQVVIGVTPADLVRRNVEAAITSKEQILDDLDGALERERASLDVVRTLPPTPSNIRTGVLLRRAICREDQARAEIERSIFDLSRMLNPTLPPLPAPAPPPCHAIGTPE